MCETEDAAEYQLLRRPKSLPDFSNLEPGLNAWWTCRYFAYKHDHHILPKGNVNVNAQVRFSQLILSGLVPKQKLKIPLVSIGYIESITTREALDVRGLNFRLFMSGITNLEETRDRLRFLVLRQRVPHCILNLPLVWKKGDDFPTEEDGDCVNFRCFPSLCCFHVQTQE